MVNKTYITQEPSQLYRESLVSNYKVNHLMNKFYTTKNNEKDKIRDSLN